MSNEEIEYVLLQGHNRGHKYYYQYKGAKYHLNHKGPIIPRNPVLDVIKCPQRRAMMHV